MVLGSGCRYCTQNQTPAAAAAGMLVRPPRCPLTLNTALHLSMYFCLSVALPLSISQADTVVSVVNAANEYNGKRARSHVPRYKHLQTVQCYIQHASVALSKQGVHLKICGVPEK